MSHSKLFGKLFCFRDAGFESRLLQLFPSPLTGEGEGGGVASRVYRAAAFHPHLNLPPSRGKENNPPCEGGSRCYGRF